MNTTQESLTYARADLAAHELAFNRRQRHAEELRVHHAGKPRPPSGDRPAEPAAGRPNALELTQAEQLLVRASQAEGAAAASDQALTAARSDVVNAEKALERAQLEASRVGRLVAACRRAPADEAAKSLAALGDVGALQVEFAGEDRGKQDPYVRLTYAGIGFELLSGGQRVLADLLFRMGLRRAAKLPALPLVVDDVQSWNGGDGPWPEVEGASIWLTTVGGGS